MVWGWAVGLLEFCLPDSSASVAASCPHSPPLSQQAGPLESHMKADEGFVLPLANLTCFIAWLKYRQPPVVRHRGCRERPGGARARTRSRTTFVNLICAVLQKLSLLCTAGKLLPCFFLPHRSRTSSLAIPASVPDPRAGHGPTDGGAQSSFETAFYTESREKACSLEGECGFSGFLWWFFFFRYLPLLFLMLGISVRNQTIFDQYPSSMRRRSKK